MFTPPSKLVPMSSNPIPAGAAPVIDGAAGIEEAVLLHQGEGIPLPVRPIGLDHVNVGEKEDGLQPRVRPGEGRHQGALLGLTGRDHHLHLPIGVARGLEAHREALGRQGATAGREGRVRLYELLVEITEGDLVWPQDGLGRRSRGDRGGAQKGETGDQQGPEHEASSGSTPV